MQPTADPAAPAMELVWDARCAIAESCTWDAARRWVWFCDIETGVLHAFDTANRAQHRFRLPAPVGSLGLCESGRLVVALRASVVLFDPATGALEVLAELPDVPAGVRLNDGKVGPDGCFWVGTADEREPRQATGALYRIQPDGGVRKAQVGAQTSNGLAWSPDGRTLFHSDSRGPWIDRWDFDVATGAIANRLRIATPDAAEGRPDGAACDADGNYWSAGVSAGCLNCFSPGGQLLCKLATPVPAPTMPCFADGQLYLTSLRKGLEAHTLARHPASGGLWRAPFPLAGAPVALFKA